MTETNTLYSELKPDIETLAGTLFDLSQRFLEETDNFLPHGAVLTANGEVVLFGASPETDDDYTDSTEVLPILHEGLRTQVSERSIRALAVAENVTINPSAEDATEEIKVLFEHERGLTVALYLPFEKEPHDGYTFGDIFSVSAQPEVNAWPMTDILRNLS